MAISPAGAALTEAHRAQQVRNGALIAYVVARLWLRSVKLTDISGSAAQLVEKLIPLIRQRHATSQQLARAYYSSFRAAEMPLTADGFSLPDLGELNLEALQTSLRVTGEVALKKRISTLPLDEQGQPVLTRALLDKAMGDTATEISGAATRHVMNGGRDEIQSAIRADRIALGYIRVTDSDPCYFCSLLASRGPVYGEDSFSESDPRFIGEGSHKVHDHCGCSLEPVFSRKTQWPGKAKEFQDLWTDVTSDGTAGKEAIRQFRRRLEGRA
jgi:hypothetical protein